MQKRQLVSEGLKTNDLRGFVSEYFTIDRYTSKMGEDEDIVVLSFKVSGKHPAMDLMEFIETSYNFILDADMSLGEEIDGHYKVFVELERTPKVPGQLKLLMNGLSQLCDSYNWKFRYQKSKGAFPFSEEKIVENVPLDRMSYQQKILEIKNTSVNKFFNRGALENIHLDENNNLTFIKPFFGPLKMKFIKIGKYDDLKKDLPGPLSLDENGQSQVYFLQKYLGDYDINKIGDKFLIINGNYAVIAEKDSW